MNVVGWILLAGVLAFAIFEVVGLVNDIRHKRKVKQEQEQKKKNAASEEAASDTKEKGGEK